MRARFRSGAWELRAVWALLLLDGVVVLATYARIPARELYHVSGGGFVDGGLSRLLVYANFPVAIAAVGVVAVAAPRLPRRALPLAALSVVLCAVTAFVVDQSNLDAKWSNAVPAVGVALAVALSAAARGLRSEPRVRGDRLRVAAAVVLVLAAAPVVAADLGFYLDGVPLLGRVFETRALRTQPGDPVPHHAVHHGHHHGMDGLLLAVCALLLSRLLPQVRSRVAEVYLSLLLAYGVANLVNDLWLEQVVKRGWTAHEVPDVQKPALNLGWLAILVAGAAVWAAWFRQPSRTTPSAARPAISSSP